MSDLLAGKKVLITGSTHGIGKAYAGAMLKSGAQVVVNSFGSDPPPGLIDELSSLGPCHYVGANMAEMEGAQAGRWSSWARRCSRWRMRAGPALFTMAGAYARSL